MARACRHHAFVALLLLGAALAACSRRSPPTAQAPSGTVITRERIAASGAKTAWDAIRLTVPNIQLRETRGNAAKIQRRGRSSLYLDDQVRVILDDVRMEDIRALQHVAAADILTIRVLNGLDATTYYGGTSTSGVIVITTIHGP